MRLFLFSRKCNITKLISLTSIISNQIMANLWNNYIKLDFKCYWKVRVSTFTQKKWAGLGWANLITRVKYCWTLNIVQSISCLVSNERKFHEVQLHLLFHLLLRRIQNKHSCDYVICIQLLNCSWNHSTVEMHWGLLLCFTTRLSLGILSKINVYYDHVWLFYTTIDCTDQISQYKIDKF